MRKLTSENTSAFPVKVLQFGEGNFLRAFIDWMIDIMNEKGGFDGSVAVIQPLETGMVDMLNKQHGLYHHIRQGVENGTTVDEARLIRCISKAINPFADMDAFYKLAEEPELKLVFSNTTEAGIAFDQQDQPASTELASTFPGKLTQLLLHRFRYFKGDADKGLAIIPCELIEQNGHQLKKCIQDYIDLWNSGDEFARWVDSSCSFANTLVDRIVPGYPKEEVEQLSARIGYDDQLMVKSESFHLFVIEAPERVRELFPADRYGLNVKYVKDITPYRTQKVRILNGAHTSMVPIGLLYNLETVSETVNDPEAGTLIREMIFDEIVPTIQVPGEDPREFAEQIISRFQNPFIRHELLTISLNSIAKFKVRVLPTLLDYLQLKESLPSRLVFSFACLIQLYLSDKYTLKDSENNLSFFSSIKTEDPESIVSKVLANQAMWDQDLTAVPGLKDQLIMHLQSISSRQIKEAIQNL